MFEEIYRDIVTDKKVKLIGIWDKDGLEIDKIIYQDGDRINTDVIGAEIADVTSRLSELKYQNAYHLKLEYQEFDIFVFSLMKEYFLLMATAKDAISTKIKYLVDIHKDRIIAKL